MATRKVNSQPHIKACCGRATGARIAQGASAHVAWCGACIGCGSRNSGSGSGGLAAGHSRLRSLRTGVAR